MDAQQLHGGVAPQASDPESELVQDTIEDTAEEVAPPVEPFTWQASEYQHHPKGAAWYLGLFLILALLIAIAVFTKQWLAIAVFVLMIVAVVVYAGKQPRDLSYTLDDQGITIGEKSYLFHQFKSFGIIQDEEWHTIDLEPTQRFMPRLTILFEPNDLDEITERLTAQLPRFDRPPDLVERAARSLRF